MKYRYSGPIEGRVIDVEKSNPGALEITFDRVNIGKIFSWCTQNGQCSSLVAIGFKQNFDFCRKARFLKLGAVGLTRTRSLLLQPAEETLDLK